MGTEPLLYSSPPRKVRTGSDEPNQSETPSTSASRDLTPALEAATPTNEFFKLPTGCPPVLRDLFHDADLIRRKITPDVPVSTARFAQVIEGVIRYTEHAMSSAQSNAHRPPPPFADGVPGTARPPAEDISNDRPPMTTRGISYLTLRLVPHIRSRADLDSNMSRLREIAVHLSSHFHMVGNTERNFPRESRDLMGKWKNEVVRAAKELMSGMDTAARVERANLLTEIEEGSVKPAEDSDVYQFLLDCAAAGQDFFVRNTSSAVIADSLEADTDYLKSVGAITGDTLLIDRSTEKAERLIASSTESQVVLQKAAAAVAAAASNAGW